MSGVTTFSKVSTYGIGLGPDSQLTGNSYCAPGLTMYSCSESQMETFIQQYLVPMGVKDIQLGMGWSDYANTSTTLVAGGNSSWVNNWLQASEKFGLGNYFQTTWYGYSCCSGWLADAISDYPSILSANATGYRLTPSMHSEPVWTVANPNMTKQFENDFAQLYEWYGKYSSWVGMGEGCCADGTSYYTSGGISTAFGWDNYSLSAFAKSDFFDNLVNSSGYYKHAGATSCDNTLSKVWQTFDDPIPAQYDTNALSSEILHCDNSNATSINGYSGGFFRFMDYEEAVVGYNVTQYAQSTTGRTFIWYGSGADPNLIPNFKPQYYMSTLADFTSCIGGSSYACYGGYWPSHTEKSVSSFLSQQGIGFDNWISVGNILDNNGYPQATDFLGQYLMNYPTVPAQPLSFGDWSFGDPACCGRQAPTIDNLTEQLYTRSFGQILNRMDYFGSYFGTEKSAVRVLFIEGGNDYGLLPEFLTPAVNVTLTPYGSIDQSNLTIYGNLNQFNVIVGLPNNPTTSFLQRLQAFVKNGGGWVDVGYGAFSYSPNQNTASAWPFSQILGLQTNSTSASCTTPIVALTGNAITAPYTSISTMLCPHLYNYDIQKLGNESAAYYVTDSKGNPIISVNSYYSGRGVLFDLPSQGQLLGNPSDTAGGIGAPRDSYVSLLINSIFYAAHKDNMLPILWETQFDTNTGVCQANSNYGCGWQNWSPFLQFSIDGSPGSPPLLWVSNNDSSSSPFDIHLNATFYDVSTSGWIAINIQDMSVVGKGIGSDIHISTSVPAYSWEPIYIMNDTSSSTPQVLYSTASIVSSSSSGSSTSYSISGPSDASTWLVLSLPEVVSVSSTASGALQAFNSLQPLNSSKIGYYCTSVNSSVSSSGACTSWAYYNQEVWFYDQANRILYVHFQGANSMTISVLQNTQSPTTNLTPNSSSSSTAAGQTTGSSTSPFVWLIGLPRDIFSRTYGLVLSLFSGSAIAYAMLAYYIALICGLPAVLSFVRKKVRRYDFGHGR
jgi:hypothetical protein